MGASDLIKALQNLARRGPSTYGESGLRHNTVHFTILTAAVKSIRIVG
jgi:hypothetical protein